MECTIPQAGVAAIAVSLERDVRGAKRPNIEVDNSRPVRGRVAAANVRINRRGVAASALNDGLGKEARKQHTSAPQSFTKPNNLNKTVSVYAK